MCLIWLNFLFEKLTFLSPQKTLVVDTQKKLLKETVLLSTQNKLDKKLFTIYFMLEFLGFYFTLEFLGYVVKSQLESKYNSVPL